MILKRRWKHQNQYLTMFYRQSRVFKIMLAFDFDRYKFIVDVTIGEFKGQGISSASRSLWESTTDSYASYSFKNVSIF